MSFLVGSGRWPVPVVDPRLSRAVSVHAACEIPEEVQHAFTLVTMAIAQQMEREGRAVGDGLPINCLFIPDATFTISLSPDQLAVCMRLAVYPVSSLSAASTQLVQMMILAEELCHLLWGIADEVRINDKVLEVLRNLFPDLTQEQLGYKTETEMCPERTGRA